MIKTDKNETITKGQMEKLLEKHEELVTIPAVGDIITGTIIEKTRNTMYVDLGAIGVGVIYGKELFDDIDTFKNSKIGDPIQATVEKMDNEDGYTELSLRSASRERSWQELKQKMQSGEPFQTEILDANKGGLIVRMSGVAGFLPVSQLAPDHYPRVEGGDRNKILEKLKSYIGEKFSVKIITASQDDEKLIVSEKAVVGDAMSETLQKLSKGKTVEGVVSGIVDFGVFVKFKVEEKELEGLVHISELAWQRIDNPANFVTIGDNVQAKIIGVDGLRISLSMKQLKEDPWRAVTKKYSLGDKVKGEILKVTPFGAFVKLDSDIHGLLHVSELPDSFQKDPQSFLRAGDTKEFTIISLEPEEHRLGLSMRVTGNKAEAEQEKEKKKTASATTKKTAKTKKTTTKKAEKKKKEDKAEDQKAPKS
jgi:small subunit ribosomal protein S1